MKTNSSCPNEKFYLYPLVRKQRYGLFAFLKNVFRHYYSSFTVKCFLLFIFLTLIFLLTRVTVKCIRLMFEVELSPTYTILSIFLTLIESFIILSSTIKEDWVCISNSLLSFPENFTAF